MEILKLIGCISVYFCIVSLSAMLSSEIKQMKLKRVKSRNWSQRIKAWESLRPNELARHFIRTEADCQSMKITFGGPDETTDFICK